MGLWSAIVEVETNTDMRMTSGGLLKMAELLTDELHNAAIHGFAEPQFPSIQTPSTNVTSEEFSQVPLARSHVCSYATLERKNKK